MRIVLLRHGKPDIPEHGKFSAGEINWQVKLPKTQCDFCGKMS